MSTKTSRARILTAFFIAALFLALPGRLWNAQAAPPTPPSEIFDDFEDNDAGDWGFFGGNNAGGGGGTADDRPKEGSYYLSTGWGGQGSASVFYGGFFKNLDNGAQLVLPADPWFNVWVYNQSDATADSYTLEITIREDLDGNGWTNGQEDSFRLDTVFPSSAFNDEWVLVSAPVSSFVDLFTGGDGTFNGNLDEMVVVISGVQGPDPSVVEVDFDLFAFTSGGPLAFSEVLFDDMEHGNPFANGWFVFGGSVGGGGIGAETADLPPALGGAFSLGTGWGSGGVPGFFGGFGRTFLSDLSGTTYFNFWINPDGGQDYTLEINLQDDDDGDDAATNPNDDEFQYNCVISAAGPCAISGGGWQLVSIPLDDFLDDNSFLTGGNGVFDPIPAGRGGDGQLVNIVFVVVSNSGADATFRTDYWTFTEGPLQLPPPRQLIDDFESGLPSGTDGDGNQIGFFTFNDPGSSVAIQTTDTIPPPGSAPGPNNVLQVDTDVNDSFGFAGVIHAFENQAVDTWTPQNWASFEGFSFWLYGNNTGKILFIDILDNRAPGTTGDTAERFSIDIIDDFSGWKFFEIPFADFSRKEIGNSAPNDGFTLTQVHGWAFGVFNAGLPFTNYLDDVYIYGEAEIPDLAVTYSVDFYETTEGAPAEVTVKVNRPIGAREDDPSQVSVDFFTEALNSATPGLDYTDVSGTLTFVQGGASEQTFQVPTLDDNKYEGTERVLLRLTNPVDVALGFVTQSRVDIFDDEAFDPLLKDDFERGSFLWAGQGPVELSTLEILAGSPAELPGQGTVENVLRAAFPSADAAPFAVKQNVISDLNDLLPTGNSSTDRGLRRAIAQIQLSLNPVAWVNQYFLDGVEGNSVFTHERAAMKELSKLIEQNVPESPDIQQAIDDLLSADATLAEVAIEVAIYNEGDADAIAMALAELAKAEALVESNQAEKASVAYRKAWKQAILALSEDEIVPYPDLKPAGFSRDLALGEDWSAYEGLSFWYYGTGSGDNITVLLKDNRASDPGPGGWDLSWADEFNDPAGTPPNPDNWGYEIGDGSVNGIPGWGNQELEYYTDSTDNVSMDGLGNLVITAREADGSLECYYGPCAYTSARLLSQYRAEFAYGRIESRILVPQGEGLWPAFWSLGTDIGEVGWPQTGEIDFMEFVGRLPNEIFGTIHGPGYSGGQSYGDIFDFGEPVFNDFHTFVVEWEPDSIKWYVDGNLYHTATPADVAPNEWVFNDPVFLLLNVAIGGNFGGPVGDDTVFPQSMKVDYVRVYQGPDTAERFEATFMDNTAGWKQVVLPFSAFARSAEQPAGAPDDGLNLTEVWGYGLQAPEATFVGEVLIDQVRLVAAPPPTEITVTTLADSGSGSLRAALGSIADGGTISFDPGLAGGTIALSSGQLVIDRDVTVDGSGAPGLIVSGSNASRVFEIAAGVEASMNDLVIADGAGSPQGGGIRNYGILNLDYVVVTNNTETSAPPANFQFGGGGIYNGDGATLNLTNSTVSNNTTLNQPGGGVYGFFNSTLNITNSTVSGNLAAVDVAGGLRSLGDVNIVNSTFSGNVSTAWHGGAIFHTDGQLNVTNSTVVGNSAPPGTAAGIVVATFGGGAPDLFLVNTIVANNVGGVDCAVENQGGSGTITSGGHNIDSDNTCLFLVAPGDQPGVDPMVGLLADNGGPTLTHALLADSTAIDAGDNAACPLTDQRGVTRDASCDIGAYEFP